MVLTDDLCHDYHPVTHPGFLQELEDPPRLLSVSPALWLPPRHYLPSYFSIKHAKGEWVCNSLCMLD
jgi:hypothetical protein